MFEEYRLRNYNFKLLFLVLTSIVLGTLSINSADSSYLKKQIAGAVICVIGLIALSLISYKLISKFYMVLYVVNIVLLIAVKTSGIVVNNARRWLGVKDVLMIQPSELSTTVDIFVILFAMLFIAGLSYKLILIGALCLIPLAGSFLWYIKQPDPMFLKEYQRTRILSHLYPEDYGETMTQQNNSVMAIGSGQLTGKGLNNSTITTVKDANLISEQQTDFIFSVVGEELGFVGSSILVVILGLIVLQCIKVARKANDDKGTFIATGVATLIGFQTFINIGVATSLLPNTGIPLPFISYGLSSLVTCCAGIGMVINISLQRRKY